MVPATVERSASPTRRPATSAATVGSHGTDDEGLNWDSWCMLAGMDTALLKTIASLPRDEQIELIEAVWDGLVANDMAPAVSDAQRAELDRRLDAMERDPTASVTWDEILARVERR